MLFDVVKNIDVCFLYDWEDYMKKKSFSFSPLQTS